MVVDVSPLGHSNERKAEEPAVFTAPYAIALLISTNSIIRIVNYGPRNYAQSIATASSTEQSNTDGFLVSLKRVRMTLCMLYNILIVKGRAPLFD